MFVDDGHDERIDTSIPRMGTSFRSGHVRIVWLNKSSKKSRSGTYHLVDARSTSYPSSS